MNRGTQQKLTELQQVVEEEVWKFDRDFSDDDDDAVVVIQKSHWEKYTHTYTQKGVAGKHTHPQVVSSTLRVKTIQLLKNLSSFVYCHLLERNIYFLV